MTKTAKVALIGVGGMAALHAKAVSRAQGIEFVSCASRTQQKAAQFAAEHNIANARTVDQVLADPQADAIWIVAPADKMADLAADYAAPGLPLFLEKPVGYSVEETTSVCEKVKVPNMVGLNRRFYGIFDQARKLIDNAGGIRSIEMQITEYPTGMIDHYSQTILEGWNYGNSVHMIDLFRFFGGEVKQVTSKNKVNGLQDRTYLSLLEFENGANGIYNAQWYAASGWRVTLYADDLSIQFQPVEQATVYTRTGRETLQAPEIDVDFKPGLVAQAEAFGRLVNGGTLDKNAADLTEYLKTQKLIETLSSTEG